jgi:thioredoxin reductase (NADPH)
MSRSISVQVWYYGVASNEAVFHRDGNVFVVGGADSAGQAALHLAGYARRVTLIVRGDSLAAACRAT